LILAHRLQEGRQFGALFQALFKFVNQLLVHDLLMHLQPRAPHWIIEQLAAFMPKPSPPIAYENPFARG